MAERADHRAAIRGRLMPRTISATADNTMAQAATIRHQTLQAPLAMAGAMPEAEMEAEVAAAIEQPPRVRRNCIYACAAAVLDSF